MNNKFEQLKNKAENTRMTEAEKSLMRARIQETMEHFPMREASGSTGSVKSSFKFVAFARSVAFVLVGFVAGGGGLAFASEQSLPGDVLYAIKTEVMEEVVSVFQRTPESKIVWEEKRIARRAAESVALNSQGRLAKKEGRTIIENIEKSNRRIDIQTIALSKDLSFNGVVLSALPVNINNDLDTSSRDRLIEEPEVESSFNNESLSSEAQPLPLPEKEDDSAEKIERVEVSQVLMTSLKNEKVKKETVLQHEELAEIALKKIDLEIEKLVKNEDLDERTKERLAKLVLEAEKAFKEKETKLFFTLIRDIKSILEKYLSN
ncbi:MAG: hypothetical protein ACI88L_000242 [Candidatus Paceibacteria bacterium]|jgi:hypothetical protein